MEKENIKEKQAKKRKFIIITSIVIILLVFVLALPQTKEFRKTLPFFNPEWSVLDSTEELDTYFMDSTISRSYIIEFNEEPIIKLKQEINKEINNGRSVSMQREVSKRENKFGIEREEVLQVIKNKKVKRDFKYVMNAIVVNLTQEEVELLENNDQVKKVWKNSRRNLSLRESIPLINADDVWTLQSGVTSTTIQLQDADTENLEDTSFYSDNADYVAGHLSENAIQDNTDAKRRFQIKFGIGSVPSGSTIESALVCINVASSPPQTSNISIYHVYNQNWTESSLSWNNQTCGTDFDNSDQCNLTASDNINISGGGWKCLDATSIVKTDYANNSENTSIIFKTLETGSFNNLQVKTKEYPTQKPYLNITYTSPSTGNVTGTGVKIAVLDSGIDYTHPYLGNCSTENFTSGNCGRFEYGWDFVNNDSDPMDDYTHGTHVTGIVAGDDPDRNATYSGYTGVAPNSTIITYKVCGSGGSCEDDDIIAGIENATLYGVDIITMSFGAFVFEDEEVLKPSLQTAYDSGIISVASAGNDGTSFFDDGSNTMSCPACIGFVIGVGAINKANVLDTYSSRGFSWDSNFTALDLKPDVVSYGTEITSAKLGGGVIEYHGTSMSAPHVTGTIALIKQMHPDWSANEVKSALINTAKHISTNYQGHKTYNSGGGNVDALRSVNSSLIIYPYKKLFNYNLTNDINGFFYDNTTFFISNLDNYSVNYSLSFIYNDFEASFNTTFIEIPANGNYTFFFNISVNNSELSSNFTSLSGKIYINSSNQKEYTIPIAVSVFIIREYCSNFLGNGVPYIINSSHTFDGGYCFLPDITRKSTFFSITGNNSVVDCNESIFDSFYIGTSNGYTFKIDGDNVTLKNCNIRRIHTPIFVNKANAQITENNFNDTVDLIASAQANHTHIFNNTFSNWRYSGIQLGFTSHANIENNLFENATSDDVLLLYAIRGGSNYMFHHNIINNVRGVINNDGGHNISIFNNVFNVSSALSNFASIDSTQDIYIYNNIANTYWGLYLNRIEPCPFEETLRIYFYNNVQTSGKRLTSFLNYTAYYWDSTINVTGSDGNDLRLYAGSILYLTNITFPSGYATDIYAGGKLYRQWWVDVNVTNSSGDQISSANITSYKNISGGWESVVSNTTNENGLSRVYGIELFENETGLYSYKVNITIIKDGYVTNNTIIALLDDNLDLNVILESEANNEYPLFSNDVETPANNTEYVEGVTTEFNITIFSTNGTSGIDFEDVNYTLSNSTASLFNWTTTGLSAGTYGYYYWAYGNGTDNNYNTSLTYDYTIAKNNSLVIGNTATTPIEYPTTTDFTGSGCPTQLSCSLNISNEIYGVGTISTNYSTAGNMNYTATSIDFTVTINQNSSLVISLSGTSPITYGTAGDFEGTGCPGELTCTLYRDGNTPSNPDNSVLGVGTYDYQYNTTGNTNYSATNTSVSTLTVNQATSEVNLTLNDTQANITITQGESIDLNCSTIIGEASAYLTLYREGTLINNGTSPIGNTTTFNDVGILNITCYYEDSQNYSGSFETWWVNISLPPDNEYPLFSNYWDNNATLVSSGIALFNVTLLSTNGTVWLEINDANYSAKNVTADVYNASYTFSSEGDYTYRWHSWGNGTNENYNVSEDRSYTVKRDTSSNFCKNLQGTFGGYIILIGLIGTIIFLGVIIALLMGSFNLIDLDRKLMIGGVITLIAIAVLVIVAIFMFGALCEIF